MPRPVDLVPLPRAVARAGVRDGEEPAVLLLELSRIADRLAVLAQGIDDVPEPSGCAAGDLSGALGLVRAAVQELRLVAARGCDAPPGRSTGGASQSPSNGLPVVLTTWR